MQLPARGVAAVRAARRFDLLLSSLSLCQSCAGAV